MSWFTAPLPSQRWAVSLGALATVAAGPLHAQDTAKRPPRIDDPNAPVVVRAEEIIGRPDREVILERDAELIKGATRMTADTACYNAVEDQVTAKGRVNLWRFGDRYKGDALQLNLDSGQGWILHPEYRLEQSNGQGKANRVDFLNQDEALLVDGTYSTCDGPNPDWYLKADTLRLDSGRDVGQAGKTVVYFKGVPIIGTPAMSFSLSGARRSGWLPPSIGFGSKGSAEVMVPYYFNIAPNRDLTLYPRMIFARGLQMGATARYLGETDAGPYSGETRAELLVHDRITNTDRWLLNSVHAQALEPHWSYGWNLHAASDDQYPADFSKSIANSAERQLLREVRTDYQTPFFSVSARVQNYQVLQDPAAATDPSLTVPRPYDRLPQINVHTGRYDVAGFDWSVDAEATRFWHPDLIRGDRELLRAQLSYPVVRPGYFITPKVMVQASKYQLDGAGNNPVPAGPESLSLVVPTFSLDSGLIFERPSTLFGRAITQTLEPRLFYVRTPFKDQSQFPNFDTAEADFNFAQIFTENRFIGSDRIGDANQITAALTSRYIEDNGVERLRLALGQRFYFNQQRVQLDPTVPLDQSRSDVLLAAAGRVSDVWTFDSAIQYDASARQVSRSNYGVQWMAGEKKVVNAEYRYQRDSFKNMDLSSQWPLSLRWYGVGRVSYSLSDRKVLESLIGLEYKADCWVFRMGAQRFVTAAQTTSTPVFFQLELNGLSKLGFGNPLESFYKGIPGYTRLNPVTGR
ncbi:MAG: OstA organic solvent tolerance protein [Massilia sp.]|nr:OstA organic solvent tolerance protein [Massilia sp.]